MAAGNPPHRLAEIPGLREVKIDSEGELKRSCVGVIAHATDTYFEVPLRPHSRKAAN
jgi:hypothetical protein